MTMGQKMWMERLHPLFIWFSNLAYLNLLWIVFTLLGGIILGFIPSTSALFSVIRQLLRKNDEEIPITKIFWTYYRKDFWKINRNFYLLICCGFIFLADIFI